MVVSKAVYSSHLPIHAHAGGPLAGLGCERVPRRLEIHYIIPLQKTESTGGEYRVSARMYVILAVC